MTSPTVWHHARPRQPPPEITGPLDADYLAAALRRAGRLHSAAGTPRLTPLTSGRTGARVTAVDQGAAPGFVVKAVPQDRGIAEGIGNAGEAAFWLTGLSRSLPVSIFNPTIDVARHAAHREWWLLMDDVSAGMLARSEWGEQHTRRLFEAVAELHAHHWETDPDPSVDALLGTTGALVETALHAATGEATAPWVARASQEFPVPRMLMPAFLEMLHSGDVDFYLTLCRRWREVVTALERFPATLIHGDLRRANIAMFEDRVALLDWEFLATGPAAVDLTWHWFLHYWAYPPADGKPVDDRLWLRDAYLDRLETLLGTSVDRDSFHTAWELGWLRVFSQLGFLLADTLPENPSSEEIEHTRWLCSEAVTRAKRVVDAHVR